MKSVQVTARIGGSLVTPPQGGSLPNYGRHERHRLPQSVAGKPW